jgi:hypothetical protein
LFSAAFTLILLEREPISLKKRNYKRQWEARRSAPLFSKLVLRHPKTLGFCRAMLLISWEEGTPSF